MTKRQYPDLDFNCLNCGAPVHLEGRAASLTHYFYCNKPACHKIRRQKIEAAHVDRRARYQRERQAEWRESAKAVVDKRISGNCPDCGGPVLIEGTRGAPIYYRRCKDCRLKIESRIRHRHLEGDFIYAY